MIPTGEDRKLLSAVQSLDFPAIELATREYARMAAAQAMRLPPAEGAALLREACRLLEGARRSVCVARARAESRLRDLHTAAAYHAAESTVCTWGIEG